MSQSMGVHDHSDIDEACSKAMIETLENTFPECLGVDDDSQNKLSQVFI